MLGWPQMPAKRLHSRESSGACTTILHQRSALQRHARLGRARRSDPRGELILANSVYASGSATPLATYEKQAARQYVRTLLSASFARPFAPEPEFASEA
jgi:Flp pilus assembly protein TadD